MSLITLSDWPEIAGYLASGLVFLTFCMKTLIPLRVLAILSNIAFIAYSWGAGLMPVLILHAALLPLNLIRTAEQIRLRSRVRAAAQGDLSVDHLLAFMQNRRCRAGEILFHKGDPADFMFYLADGYVRLEEVDKTIGPGALVGEIGLFAGDGRRMATVRCLVPCEICVLTQQQVQRLFHQNPAFGFFLTRLITNRLLENQKNAEAQLAEILSGPDDRDAAPAPLSQPLPPAPASVAMPERAAHR
ncbi:MAG: cyclic nucleotide-binding domain-containing protein [Pseudomonadota bacterium]